MSVRQYRKKPIVINAVQFTDNADEIVDWAEGAISKAEYPAVLKIETLEGNVLAHVGDWVIKGIGEEFYPCAPDIFEATYERVAGR